MSADVGRNDPCPCGSGKKYKKCCMLAERPPAGSLTHAVVSECYRRAIDAILEFMRRPGGRPTDLAQAWMEFCGTQDELDAVWARRDPQMPLFFVWLAYLRTSTQREDGVLQGGVPAPDTLAARFVRDAGYRVDERTRRYIEVSRREPFAFWQVLEVKREVGMLLRDMATGRERHVYECSATRTVVPWDILFGQVVGLDDVHILNASGAYLLPAVSFRQRVEALLAELGPPPDPQDTAHWLRRDLELIHAYLGYAEEALHPTLPELRNSDGHRLEWSTSSYRFVPDQRGRILGRLDSMRNIESHADEPGQYTWVSQRQDAPIPGASKARIEVQDERLITECNSRERDRALRARLQKELADLAQYEDTEYKPLDPESLRQVAGEGSDTPAEPAVLSAKDRAALRRVVDQLRMRWADGPVPALGGKTPRAAVKTAEGRRQVADLINDFENMEARQPEAERFDYNRLRRELGLEES